MIAARPSYGLSAPLLRHAIVVALAAGAVIAQGLVLAVPVDAQFVSWIAVAVGVGVLSALLARRVLGVLFVVVGTTLGMLAIFVIELGTTATVSVAATAVGLLYLEVLETATLAYLLTAIMVLSVRRRR